MRGVKNIVYNSAVNKLNITFLINGPVFLYSMNMSACTSSPEGERMTYL